MTHFDRRFHQYVCSTIFAEIENENSAKNNKKGAKSITSLDLIRAEGGKTKSAEVKREKMCIDEPA